MTERTARSEWHRTTATPMSRSRRSGPLGTEVLTPGKTGCAGALEVRRPAIRNSGFDSRPAQSEGSGDTQGEAAHCRLVHSVNVGNAHRAGARPVEDDAHLYKNGYRQGRDCNAGVRCGVCTITRHGDGVAAWRLHRVRVRVPSLHSAVTAYSCGAGVGGTNARALHD